MDKILIRFFFERRCMDGRMAGYKKALQGVKIWVGGMEGNRTKFVLFGVDTSFLLCGEYHKIDCSYQWQN